MKKITILTFSGRNQGNSSNIMEFITQFHNNSKVHKHAITNHFQACGGCNYECLQPGPTCPNVTVEQTQIMQDVMHSDVTYLIIPNYCGFPCANYLAFNERSVGFFNMDRAVMGQYMAAKKRFIIVSNSENAVFDQAMRQQTKEEPDVLYLKTSKYGKRSTAGDILDSDEAKSDLTAFLNSYKLD